MTTDTKERPAAKARGLGKGLSALMGDTPAYDPPKQSGSAQAQPQREAMLAGGRVATLFLDDLRPGRYQPRTHFEPVALAELAESIRINGVMQPILVRELPGSKFEIIAGERRYRAAAMARLDRIPAIIRDLTDKEAMEIALVENVQREDLNPLEEAAGYQRLLTEFGYTQETLSGAINKSRSHVANLLRLIDLPEEIREMLMGGRLTMGHARALSGVENAVEIAGKVVEKGLSVRQTEKLARLSKGPSDYKLRQEARAKFAAGIGGTTSGNATELPPLQGLKPPFGPPGYHEEQARRAAEQAAAAASAAPVSSGPRDPDIMALEDTLSENLGLKVSIDDRGQSGAITISYDSLEQLDDILRRLGGGA